MLTEAMFIGTAWAGLGIALCWMPATPRTLYPVCWTPASPSSPTASTQRGAVFVQGLPRLPPGEGAWASAPLGSPVRAPSLLGCGWPEVARRRLGRPSPLTAAKPASVPPPRAADGPWTRGLHATPRARTGLAVPVPSWRSVCAPDAAGGSVDSRPTNLFAARFCLSVRRRYPSVFCLTLSCQLLP